MRGRGEQKGRVLEDTMIVIVTGIGRGCVAGSCRARLIDNDCDSATWTTQDRCARCERTCTIQPILWQTITRTPAATPGSTKPVHRRQCARLQLLHLPSCGRGRTSTVLDVRYSKIFHSTEDRVVRQGACAPKSRERMLLFTLDGRVGHPPTRACLFRALGAG